VGGQANAQPISLDAIDQIQVNIAPFDVPPGYLTGAGINAVTRGGTNEFQGSVYHYLRGGTTVPPLQRYVRGRQNFRPRHSIPEFQPDQSGFRLGGPILKNKLFFFINANAKDAATPAGQLGSQPQ
jgi:hypothetical protein